MGCTSVHIGSTWNTFGAFMNSIIARTASCLASLIACTSSPEKVAKYLVKNLKESFAALYKGKMKRAKRSN